MLYLCHVVENERFRRCENISSRREEKSWRGCTRSSSQ